MPLGLLLSKAMVFNLKVVKEFLNLFIEASLYLLWKLSLLYLFRPFWKPTKLWLTKLALTIIKSMEIQTVSLSRNLALPYPPGSSPRRIIFMCWEFTVFSSELCYQLQLALGGTDHFSLPAILCLSKPLECLRYVFGFSDSPVCTEFDWTF